MATMITDEWEGVRTTNRSIENVAWGDVDAAIRNLDGGCYTQVLVRSPDQSDLIIGGGAGRYNVTIATADDRFLVLKDPTKPNGVEDLIAGGQRGQYPSQTVVNLDSVLQAARVYLELGTPDSAQQWLEE